MPLKPALCDMVHIRLDAKVLTVPKVKSIHRHHHTAGHDARAKLVRRELDLARALKLGTFVRGVACIDGTATDRGLGGRESKPSHRGAVALCVPQGIDGDVEAGR